MCHKCGEKYPNSRTGDTLKIEKIETQPGQEVAFDKVLLTAEEDGTNVKIGTPYLSGVTVTAMVEEVGKNKKIRVVKYKRKVRYKRVIGHRQPFTKIKIKSL